MEAKRLKQSLNRRLEPEMWIIPSFLGILLVFFVVVAVARSYFFEDVDTVWTDQLISFRELIDHPALLGITSKLTSDGVTDFSKVLRAENHNGVLDDKIVDQSFFGADVFIFILSDWSEAALLPSREVFSEFYDDVQTLEKKDVKRVYQTARPGGPPKLFIFYKIALGDERDLPCLAKDIVLEIYSGDAVEKATHYSCSSGT